MVFGICFDVGGYTWTKYGFKAEKSEYGNIKSWVISRNNVDFDNKKKFLEWLKQYENKDIPFYEYEDFDKKYFKNIMIESDWKGFIDLTNAEQRVVFENYLKSS